MYRSCPSRSRSTPSPAATGTSPPTGCAGPICSRARFSDAARRLPTLSRQRRGPLPGARVNYLIIAALALGSILLGLLALASANSALFSRHYPLLLGLNGVVAASLAGLVTYKIWELWRDHRRREFGVRLKIRLVLAFASMAVLPGVLVYAVSVQFAVKSIDSWFDVRVDKALDGGLALAQTALGYLLEDLTRKGRSMALELGLSSGRVSPIDLNRLREQAGVASAAVIGPSGQIESSSLGDAQALVPGLPGALALRQARQGRPFSAIEGDAASGLNLRVLVPIVGTRFGSDPLVLQLLHPVPYALAQSATSVENTHRDYQELSLARLGLKRIFGLTLTLTLLLALFTAIAFAFLLSQHLSAPLSILDAGTRAVMHGDFSRRQTVASGDELGLLTQSFSRMTQQLEDARAQAEKSRAETETARAYLESVLAKLSAGVLAFSAEGKLRAANAGALAILKDDLDGYEKLRFEDWPAHADFRAVLVEGFDRGQGQWQHQLEMLRPNEPPQILLVRGSRLPDASGGGYVVVFDDITRLIDAQRTAAWGEVARRLAHEIKNPLTPIQLSAERLEYKLADKLEPAEREILERAIRTIVQQVEAMKRMVNDFRDYARLPAPQIARLDLNGLLRDVLNLYETSGPAIGLELDTDEPIVLADAALLRQVIHNLLQNAQDALTDQPDGRITLSTRGAADTVEFAVADNGPGFAPGVLGKAFEPYVTSKAKGTGLGLAIVKKIVDDHYGDIRITNLAPHGALIRISLPRAGAEG
ncbi:MAG: ATP-binding protein [Rhodocyclaceae bacterium]|nr:ATP-binding protein [Rhodocyclaceae bacterium]MBX3669598.1 ATP-binding protein [Rhodocyclaceae bacterium]